MIIHRSGSRPSRRAPAEYFTGTVWQDPIVEAEAPARLRAAMVRFDPGARTNWHTHPLGQTLHVVSGLGLFQGAEGPVRFIRPGDTIWIPAGERHWHGATPETSMTHIAMHEAEGGSNVDWAEPVGDEDYGAPREEG